MESKPSSIITEFANQLFLISHDKRVWFIKNEWKYTKLNVGSFSMEGTLELVSKR